MELFKIDGSVLDVRRDSFLAQYMDWMDVQETPHVYDLMCGLWCLSIALGRDTVVARPRAPVHLNMYLILVSESGIMRKSTSIRMATSVVREFLQTHATHVSLIESKVTMGKLLEELTHGTAH